MTDFVRNSVAFPQRAHSAHVTTARNVAPATVTHRPASSLITADIICASERSAAGKNAITCHKNRPARNPASACNALAARRSPRPETRTATKFGARPLAFYDVHCTKLCARWLAGVICRMWLCAPIIDVLLSAGVVPERAREVAADGDEAGEQDVGQVLAGRLAGDGHVPRPDGLHPVAAAA